MGRADQGCQHQARRVKVLVLDDIQQGVVSLPCMRLLDGHEVRVFTRPVAAQPDAAAAMAEAEILVLIRERTVVDDALLQRMPRLRHIAQTGKAGRHLDVAACHRRGVSVSQGSGTAYAAAELALLLVMASLRNLPQEIDAMKAGAFGVQLGRTLRGSTLGILGFGKAGALLGGFAAGFGMQVLVHGRQGSLDRARAAGHQPVEDRAGFFAQCDAVSIQLRLSPETRGFVGDADLQAMRSGAVLVNTARAELVDQDALLRALTSGPLALYATDVYMQEPPTLQSDPVLQTGRVMATPHIGYLDVGSFDLMMGSAFGNVVAFAQGQPTNLMEVA